jgi:hypothetical protein
MGRLEFSGMNRSKTIIRRLASGAAPFSLLLLLTQGLVGQELPWLPRGKIRLDFAPTFWTWDTRYGLDPSGTGIEEALGLDLTGNPLGSDILPDLVDLETRLAQAMEDPFYRVQLGVSQAHIDQSRLVFPLRLELGVTDWLTIGGMVPFVRPRTEMIFALDADSLTATDGLSPFFTDAAGVINFLDQMRNRLIQAEGQYPGAPAVSDARSFLDDLTFAYSRGTFFPVLGSAPGARLQERLEELNAALAALGVVGMPQSVPLAQEYLDQESFQGFLGSPVMRAYPLEDWTTLWGLGDAEITANARLLSRGFEPDSLGTLPSLRYQLGGGILVRLGTGKQEDTQRYFDQDLGDGQLDLEGNVFGMMEFGSRVGAWGQVRYGIQTEGEVFRRITTPSQTLPAFLRTVPVKRTPGNYLEIDLNPRIFLTPAMSFGVRYHLWSKGEDSHVLGYIDPEVRDTAAIPAASLLDLETEQKLQEIGFSATYSSVESHERGEGSMPLYIRLTYLRPLSGSGGQTPKGGRFQVGLTIYKTLWGGRDSTAEELPGVIPGGG